LIQYTSNVYKITKDPFTIWVPLHSQHCLLKTELLTWSQIQDLVWPWPCIEQQCQGFPFGFGLSFWNSRRRFHDYNTLGRRPKCL